MKRKAKHVAHARNSNEGSNMQILKYTMCSFYNTTCNTLDSVWVITHYSSSTYFSFQAAISSKLSTYYYFWRLPKSSTRSNTSLHTFRGSWCTQIMCNFIAEYMQYINSLYRCTLFPSFFLQHSYLLVLFMNQPLPLYLILFTLYVILQQQLECSLFYYMDHEVNNYHCSNAWFLLQLHVADWWHFLK